MASKIVPEAGVDDTPFDPNDNIAYLEVLEAVQNITDWSVLSLVLGVSSADVERIRQNNVGKAYNQEQAIIKAWIGNRNASWAHLVTALRHKLVKKGAFASIIAREHPKGASQPSVQPSVQQAPVDQSHSTHKKSEPAAEKKLNQDLVNKRKKQIKARLSEPEFQRSDGIIFIVGVYGADGTARDVENVENTFRMFNFAIFVERDPTAEDLACLMQAAAELKDEYPYKCRYVAFYFAGHGGIHKETGKMFVVGLQQDDSKSEILPVEDYIIEPLKCLQDKKISRIFLFDCCQSEGQGTEFRGPIVKKPIAYAGEIIAYASNKGQKSFGDRKKGGIWTYNLCKNLRDMDDDIVTVLSKTTDDVTEAKESFQQPLISSSIGIRKLKKVNSGAPAAPPPQASENEAPDNSLDHKLLLKKTPEYNDVIVVVTNECDSPKFREMLKVSTGGSLNDALKEWISKETSQVTWEHLLHSLKESSNIGVVKHIALNFLKRPSVHNKYKSKADYVSVDDLF